MKLHTIYKALVCPQREYVAPCEGAEDSCQMDLQAEVAHAVVL